MKSYKRTGAKRHIKKARERVKHNIHKSDSKGLRRIESGLLGLSKEIELVDDEIIYRR